GGRGGRRRARRPSRASHPPERGGSALRAPRVSGHAGAPARPRVLLLLLSLRRLGRGEGRPREGSWLRLRAHHGRRSQSTVAGPLRASPLSDRSGRRRGASARRAIRSAGAPAARRLLIRVATVIEALGRGGAERLLVDTARHLDRGRFLLRVYTLYPVRRDYADALSALEVPEECLVLAGPRQIPAGVRRLRACLRRDGADVLHTHLFAANVVGRLAARAEALPVLST